ncbi:hypothetical protein [Streptomyces sp. NPDC029674]|uniref:hypothetical protein n=1 Tax=Streptomyces sp. NPDC029674 TaxID=3365297 RepID=UPI00384EDE8B
MRQTTQWSGASRHASCRVAPTAAPVFLTRLNSLTPLIALTSLLAALFICLGPLPHGDDHQGAGRATAVAGTVSLDERVPRVRDSDCPPGERRCAPVAHGVRAVLTPGGPSLPACDRPAPYPQALSVPGPAVEQPSDRGSPDLHMLQVQRT